MHTVTIEAPAKINLTLDVIGKRSDGYHELETVMHQVNLYDRIILKPALQVLSWQLIAVKYLWIRRTWSIRQLW